MTYSDLLRRVSNQINNQRPFVLFSSFGDKSFKAFFQKNSIAHVTTDFSESGFVMAPFDLCSKSYIIPENQSEFSSFTLNSFLKEKFYFETTVSDHDGHIKLINKALTHINKSELRKVVLARQTILKFKSLNICSLFLKISEAYPEAYTYCWFHPETGYWLGASPETLFNITNNQVQTMALAGTQAYTGSLEVNWDDKNFEEQSFVTDYIKRALSDQIIQLTVTPPKTIRAGQLVHLQSVLTGTLKESLGVLKNLISEIHPTPAVCGTPKSLAMDFILKNETINRDFYSGFLGQINQSNDIYGTSTHLVVNLRCMHIKNNIARLFAGGGITSKSIPEKEWQETEAKILTLKSIL